MMHPLTNIHEDFQEILNEFNKRDVNISNQFLFCSVYFACTFD